MTTIDEILGRCERVVEFERYKAIRLVGRCKDCTGYHTEAVKRKCDMYQSYKRQDKLVGVGK